MLYRFSPMFSSRNFIVLDFKYISLIQFYFCDGVRSEFRFTFFYIMFKHLLKRLHCIHCSTFSHLISIVLIVLGYVLWHRILSVLVCIPYELERNVYPAVIR